METTAGRRRIAGAGLIAGALALALACSGGGPTALELGADADGQTVTLVVGQSLDVILGTVGPGMYVSPPDLDGAALVFLEADFVPPFTPAGPIQRFRFRAVARGTSQVTIARTDATGVIHPSAYRLVAEVR